MLRCIIHWKPSNSIPEFRCDLYVFAPFGRLARLKTINTNSAFKIAVFVLVHIRMLSRHILHMLTLCRFPMFNECTCERIYIAYIRMAVHKVVRSRPRMIDARHFSSIWLLSSITDEILETVAAVLLLKLYIALETCARMMMVCVCVKRGNWDFWTDRFENKNRLHHRLKINVVMHWGGVRGIEYSRSGVVLIKCELCFQLCRFALLVLCIVYGRSWVNISCVWILGIDKTQKQRLGYSVCLRNGRDRERRRLFARWCMYIVWVRSKVEYGPNWWYCKGNSSSRPRL